MRSAYALLGILFLIVVVGAAYAFNRSSAPSPADTQTITSPTPSMAASSLSLTSSAFGNNENIPAGFTCDGEQKNPPLSISGVPAAAKSLVLIMDDPDVPKQLRPDGVFDHWVLFNISPTTSEIPEGGSVGIAGANGAGKDAYTGPCPPKQYEPSEHRYFFKLYALDSMLTLQAGASKTDVEKAIQGHIVSEAQLVGKYKRQ